MEQGEEDKKLTIESIDYLLDICNKYMDHEDKNVRSLALYVYLRIIEDKKSDLG